MFGVKAVSPSPEGELNFQAHNACGGRGITHMEGLDNLEAVIGKGQFRLIGFPLKSRLYVAPNCVLDSSLTSPLSLNTAVFSSTRVRLKEEVFQHA
jgi:hypothetical protein